MQQGGANLKHSENATKISFELGMIYRGKTANLGGAVISTAFVLAKIQKSSLLSTDTIETFLNNANEPEEVSAIIVRNLYELWDTVVSLIGKYDTDSLEELILYDNTYFEMSTPSSLVHLANKFLNISETDSVLDICSGCATFPVYSLVDGRKVTNYTGIEINYNLNDIAILRTSLLDGNFNFILNNALTYNYPKSYDKIFSNYPFAIKGQDIDDCRLEIQKQFNLKNSSISRCSSDWIFNAMIIRKLNKTGKAVAIMTNGAAFNKPDMIMRQWFVENGYIETVVNLPSALFSETSIPTTMIVFSYNNKSIKLINAENIYSKNRKRLNTLSEEDIQKIMDYINNGGDNILELSVEEMRDHDYNLIASHYIDKPKIENGVPFESVIKSIIRGAQVKPEILESCKSLLPTDYRYITLSNLANSCIEIEDGKQYITELPKSLEKFVAPNNSIILAKMASPTFRSVVVDTTEEQHIIATGNFYIIEIDQTKANPYFIQAFLESELGEATLNHASGGAAIKSISMEAVKSILIPLPPLEEQNKIALKYQATLDEYEILKRKLQRVLEKKRHLLSEWGVI